MDAPRDDPEEIFAEEKERQAKQDAAVAASWSKRVLVEGTGKAGLAALGRTVAAAVAIRRRQNEQRRGGQEVEAVLIESVDHLVDRPAAWLSVHGAEVVGGFQEHSRSLASFDAADLGPQQ